MTLVGVTAFAMFCPDHQPASDGHPAAWIFLWDEAAHSQAFWLRVILPIGLVVCALTAWLSSNIRVRTCALVPLTTLAALQHVVILIHMQEFSDEPLPLPILLSTLDVGVRWTLVLGTGLIAASAFRLRRGLQRGHPFRWMTVASAIAMGSIALTVPWPLELGRFPTEYRFEVWCYLGSGGLYLLLGLVTGLSKSNGGRRAISFLSRLTIGSVLWIYPADNYYFKSTSDLPAVARGIREGALVIIVHLSAAMLAVLCFHMRYGSASTDETVFD